MLSNLEETPKGLEEPNSCKKNICKIAIANKTKGNV